MAGQRTAVAAPSSRLPRSRWLVLGWYAVLAASTQLLWLSFAPVDSRVARLMHTDVGAIGDLAIIFPLVYVLLALPTGRWLDTHFRPALATGAVLTGSGAIIRIVAPASFTVQLVGQVVIAAGQPLVLNSITKVAARYFPPHERAAAISVGTVALFVGILVAVLAGSALLNAGGLSLLLTVEAVPAVIAALLTLAVLRVPHGFADDASTAVSLRWLTHDHFMWTLALLVFLGMGTYNAVATWLQPILQDHGEGGAAGGLVALMTFGGVIGAAILPSAVAARDRRRPLLIAALSLSVVVFTALAVRHDIAWYAAWLFLEGLVLMASLPVVLDWSELHAGAERQGASAGFLLMSGNLGGLVLPGLVQAVLGNSVLPFVVLAVAALIGVPATLRLPAGVRPRSGAA
jgi:predicted MFS family arabinose efflux permease